MNESFNPQVAAEKARETYRKTALQFEDLALNTPVSEGLRALAEKNVAQTREAYEHSKDALEVALETLERSFDALGQGATALNHKVMDIAQRNNIQLLYTFGVVPRWASSRPDDPSAGRAPA